MDVLEGSNSKKLELTIRYMGLGKERKDVILGIGWMFRMGRRIRMAWLGLIRRGLLKLRFLVQRGSRLRNLLRRRRRFDDLEPI